MKKILIGLVVVAVAVGFIGTVIAQKLEKAEMKGKTYKTTTGAEVTKEKGKVVTTEGTAKFQKKSVTKGDITKTKGKMVVKTGKPGHRTKIVGKLLQIEDNDPKNDSDNTVTIITLKNEKMNLKLNRDIKINKLEKHKNTNVVFSTYAPTAAQLVKDGVVEGFEP